MAEISFADWFIFALPVTVLLLGSAWLLLYLMYRPKKSWKGLEISGFKAEYQALGKAGPEEKTVLVLFLLLAGLWIFRTGFEIQSFQMLMAIYI